MVGRRPGPAPQTEKRKQFAELIAQGVSSLEACRMVGINPRTGKRWRNGRRVRVREGVELHYPPVINTTKREISPRYLCEDERVAIADLRRAGQGVRAIAAELGRSPSTVSRELKRNVDPGSGQYRPFSAHRLAAQRRGRCRPGKLARDAVLCRFVQDGLDKHWSPEQICEELRREFPDDPGRHVVHETIYQAIYRRERGGLERKTSPVLRSRRRRRRPHRHPDARRAGSLVKMTMIDQRPQAAGDRSEAGHWEGDLITGAANRSAIGTLVERVSRFVILLHLPGRHGAAEVRDALIAAMGALPAPLRRSLTWDQGKEMALHSETAAALHMPVFFCEPHSPWQRPTNENTNGLLREYFPKGTNLQVHDAGKLAVVAAELNTRPRKVLGWDTPTTRFAGLAS